MASSLAAAIAIVAMVLPIAAGAAQVFAHLQVFSRLVQVQAHRRGPSVDGRTGERLAAGDVVRTDAGGRAEIDYFDGSLTRLDGGTTFDIERLVGPVSHKQIGLRVHEGRTWNRVRKLTSTDSRYEVATPNAIAAVQGTTYMVDCSPVQVCAFTVVEGHVRVSDARGQVVVLTPGERVTVGPDASLGPIELLSQAQLERDPWVAYNLGLDRSAAPPPTTPTTQGSTPGTAPTRVKGQTITRRSPSSQQTPPVTSFGPPPTSPTSPTTSSTTTVPGIPAGSVTELPVPTAGSLPRDIAAGPDGNLWFTEANANKIARLTPAGTMTEFAIPTAASSPFGITPGPDGDVWFGESTANKIGRVTPSGTISEYTVPTANAQPYALVAGSDGNLWFTETTANQIGRITPAGTITEFSVPASSGVNLIAAGPDGNLWFSESTANQIGRITTSGAVTEFPVPTANAQPYGLAAGPDGNLWFPEFNGDKIGRITPSGTVTEYPLPSSFSEPDLITTGPDGNLWFTEFNGDKIGRITTRGSVSEFSIPTANAQPEGITPGPDGALWFTEGNANQIGRITV
jgi:streptogramin lyase